MYCGGNPVMFVNPDGRYLVIWYEVNGESKSFVFKGNNTNKAPKNSYVQAVPLSKRYFRNNPKYMTKKSMFGLKPSFSHNH